MKVFVYGSLRKNEVNHHYLQGAELLAEQAWVSGRLTEGEFYYPFLIDDLQAITYGELYEIPPHFLKKLDHLEGYRAEDPSSLFYREEVKVTTDQDNHQAIVYKWGNQETGRQLPEVPHGNWKVRQLLRKESYYYLAYGSCMDQERFQIGKVDHLFQNMIGAARLDDYELRFSHHVKDGGRADIAEKKGAHVEGLVYQVEKEALDYLYQREGVFTGGYRPVVVEVDLHNSRKIEVLSFTVIHKKEDLTPPLHYAREIHRGGGPHLTAAYLSQVEKRFHQLQVKGFDQYLKESASSRKGSD